MKFFIEQIALCPPNPERARALLTELGLNEWVTDHVVAGGKVFGEPGKNEADLAFNYQNTRPENKPLELEVLHYTSGPNWMAGRPPMRKPRVRDRGCTIGYVAAVGSDSACDCVSA